MNLKAKPYVENQKAIAEKNLAAHKAALAAKGLSDAEVKKNPQVRKLQADIRKADQRLAAIAAQEKLVEDKQKAKADKAAAEKKAKAPAKKKAARKDDDKAAKKNDGKAAKKETKSKDKKKSADKKK